MTPGSQDCVNWPNLSRRWLRCSPQNPFAGLFEMTQPHCGMENCCDDGENKTLAIALFDKPAELKLAFWKWLAAVSGRVDVVSQADDYGSAISQIISPRMFREQLKRAGRSSSIVCNSGAQCPAFLHSCGNVRPLIPDYIELGVEILKPVHVLATGMEPLA